VADATLLARRLGIGRLPEDMGEREVLGISALAGIGLTVFSRRQSRVRRSGSTESGQAWRSRRSRNLGCGDRLYPSQELRSATVAFPLVAESACRDAASGRSSRRSDSQRQVSQVDRYDDPG
jgi:hypothetical protein